MTGERQKTSERWEEMGGSDWSERWRDEVMHRWGIQDEEVEDRLADLKLNDRRGRKWKRWGGGRERERGYVRKRLLFHQYFIVKKVEQRERERGEVGRVREKWRKRTRGHAHLSQLYQLVMSSTWSKQVSTHKPNPPNLITKHVVCRGLPKRYVWALWYGHMGYAKTLSMRLSPEWCIWPYCDPPQLMVKVWIGTKMTWQVTLLKQNHHRC